MKLLVFILMISTFAATEASCKNTKSIEMHIKQLAANKPHVARLLEQKKYSTDDTITLEDIDRFIDIFALIYCIFRVGTKYNNYYLQNKYDPDNTVQKLSGYIYGLSALINFSKHTLFFCDALTLVVKILFVKTILKCIVYCGKGDLLTGTKDVYARVVQKR